MTEYFHIITKCELKVDKQYQIVSQPYPELLTIFNNLLTLYFVLHPFTWMPMVAYLNVHEHVHHHLKKNAAIQKVHRIN